MKKFSAKRFKSKAERIGIRIITSIIVIIYFIAIAPIIVLYELFSMIKEIIILIIDFTKLIYDYYND